MTDLARLKDRVLDHLERLVRAKGPPQLRNRVPEVKGLLRESVYVRRVAGGAIEIGFSPRVAPYAPRVKFRKPVRGARNVGEALHRYVTSSDLRLLLDEAVRRADAEMMREFQRQPPVKLDFTMRF